MYSNKLICELLMYIDKNINYKITISDIENIFFYNKYYIMKLFKKEINLTIIEYINSIRVYNSIMSIKNNVNNNLINIAIKNGFYSLEYYSETFKKITGMAPKKYKNFFSRSNTLSLDEIDKIKKTIFNLYKMIDFKKEYLKKQKTVALPTIKLSIINKKKIEN